MKQKDAYTYQGVKIETKGNGIVLEGYQKEKSKIFGFIPNSVTGFQFDQVYSQVSTGTIQWSDSNKEDYFDPDNALYEAYFPNV